MGRHGEGEPHEHAAGIALDGRFQEGFDLGEVDDLVELAADLGHPHAEDGAVEKDVLPPRKLRMKARADFQQRAHASANAGRPTRGPGDAAEDLQQGRLSGPVATDDPHDFPGVDLKAHVVEHQNSRVRWDRSGFFQRFQKRGASPRAGQRPPVGRWRCDSAWRASRREGRVSSRTSVIGERRGELSPRSHAYYSGPFRPSKTV